MATVKGRDVQAWSDGREALRQALEEAFRRLSGKGPKAAVRPIPMSELEAARAARKGNR